MPASSALPFFERTGSRFVRIHPVKTLALEHRSPTIAFTFNDHALTAAVLWRCYQRVNPGLDFNKLGNNTQSSDREIASELIKRPVHSAVLLIEVAG